MNTVVSLSHILWQSFLKKGDTAIDATCGNGHDTLFLAKAILTEESGTLYAIDRQESAIIETKKRLKENQLSLERISFIADCHSNIDQILVQGVDLIVYNLGYLPGSDKSVTTEEMTSLESIQKGLNLLRVGGIMSITCYPGHDEGKIESDAILSFAKRLSPAFSCSQHLWINRRDTAPFLLTIQKTK